jgi:hypothetical protein
VSATVADELLLLHHRPFFRYGSATVKILIDSDHVGSYSQDWEHPGFFCNVTTVLYLSGLVGGDTGPFRGQGNQPATGHRSKDRRNGRTAVWGGRTCRSVQQPNEKEAVP